MMRPIALVTGAARRLGAVLCRNLARVGYDILLHYNSSERTATLLKHDLEQHGAGVRLFKADLTCDTERDAFIEDVSCHLSSQSLPLNLLIHNASIFPACTFDKMDSALIQQLFALHLTAPLLLTQGFRPLLERARDGLVVTIGDSGCKEYWPQHVPYNLSKHSLRGATIAMAKELAPTIRVCGLEPGVILDSEMTLTLPIGTDLSANSTNRETRNQRLTHQGGNPEDLWRALFYLVASPFVSGEILKVDGGRSIAR
jgi:pteridine reductase